MAGAPQYDTMTPAERNALKAYIESPSGRSLLQLLVNREISLKAEAWGLNATTDRQVQLVNQEYGIYWVRNLIEDLIKPVRAKEK